VGGVLKYCGVPTAVRAGGRVRPLQRDAKSARRIATEAVRHVYQYGGSIKGDPLRLERGEASGKVPAQVFLRRRQGFQHRPYFIGAWDTIQTLGAGRAGSCCWHRSTKALRGRGAGLGKVDGRHVPAAIPAARSSCCRSRSMLRPAFAYKGLVSLARYRQAFYDTRLNYACVMRGNALSIDEDRASFACVPWDEETPRHAFTDQRTAHMRFKQVWFAGNHSDIGGSYPETESRLSDIALAWMVEEAISLPNPIHIDRSLLNILSGSCRPQHDERKAFNAARPRWLVRCARLFIAERNFGWRLGIATSRRMRCCIHPSSNG
jgi:hypothetical protein